MWTSAVRKAMTWAMDWPDNTGIRNCYRSLPGSDWKSETRGTALYYSYSWQREYCQRKGNEKTGNELCIFLWRAVAAERLSGGFPTVSDEFCHAKEMAVWPILGRISDTFYRRRIIRRSWWKQEKRRYGMVWPFQRFTETSLFTIPTGLWSGKEKQEGVSLDIWKRGHIWLNVKADPEWRDFWREVYPSVIPAYHLNKNIGILLFWTAVCQRRRYSRWSGKVMIW